MDVDSKMDLFLVIVLYTQNDAKVQCILVSVLLQHMDQVVEHISVEVLDVFDDKDDWLVYLNLSTLYDLLYAEEGLLAECLIVL